MGALENYNDKRDFSKTPEPPGNGPCKGEGNRYVIQRHMARREHYDFRLEVGNVLVSWAIPKKPVSDPEIKRLAVKTEDHPLDYFNFEGNIPKGNYGAGSVMVWDYGYYYSQKNGDEIPEEEAKEMIKRGSIKVKLVGMKLKGDYKLVKIKSSDKNEWLFMKGKEKPPENFQERSALTGRTMEQIAEEKEEKKENIETETHNEIEADYEGKSFAIKTEFPGFISPMLATPVEKAFSDINWIYEFKLDGYRLISTRYQNEVRIFSRNGHDFNKKYPIIAKELKQIKAEFVADGELCYMKNDRPDFQKLQNDTSDHDNIHYYVFDLLWLNGHDLRDVPLLKRKAVLAQLLSDSPEHIHYLDHIKEKGEVFFDKIQKENLEGILAKKYNSSYYSNYRSGEWLKIKTSLRQEMVIVGYAKSDKTDREFRSLLCAVSTENGYKYTGKVGTGFNQQLQQQILEKLSKIELKEAPVENPPSGKGIIWVKPGYICEVRFSEWTGDNIMRHPSFIALRSDKKPEEIKIRKPEKLSVRRKFTLSNPDKIFWPKEKIRKKDVYNYYESISEIILPHLINRPQSLYRTPDGITKKGFFQKNMEELAPAWAETVKVAKDESRSIEYLLCQDTDTLLYMVNLGCIELNPWSASVPDLEHPDLMIFDLDPVEVEYKILIDVAIEFRDLFEKLSIPAYCKTSGSRGLHIYIPVKPEYSYKQVQNFVRIIQSHVHKKMPGYTSFERSPSKRTGKIYLDYLQNGKGKTMSSVYSLRPREGATVSTPIKWEELNYDLKPSHFNIDSVPGRIEKFGDIWGDMLEEKVDLKKILEQI
jgi:bifunctional non-homologous end joining protein LigD